MYCNSHEHKTYTKPTHYHNMATVESINSGQPYYVAGPTHGYEGLSHPVAGTVSVEPECDSETGKLSNRVSMHTSTWVTCTASRYQFGVKFRRCSLSDDGVIHQTYSDRLAFLTEESARYYASTGRTKPFKGRAVNDMTMAEICKALGKKVRIIK